MLLYDLHFNWLSSLLIFIPLIVGIGFFTIYLWYPKQNQYTDKKSNSGHKTYVCFKWIGWIIGTFCFMLFILVALAHISDYFDKKDAMKNGDVLQVEGYVEEFHAQPITGHDCDHFEINGVYFEYSNGLMMNGYNCPACFGGVINKNGQYLKITYITDSAGENIILRIEE